MFKIIYISLLISFLSNCSFKSKKVVNKREYSYDTIYSNMPVRPMITIYKYDHNKQLVYGCQYFMNNSTEVFPKYSLLTDYQDSFKVISQIIEIDSIAGVFELKLNNVLAVTYTGDTLCEKSDYLQVLNLPDTLNKDSNLIFGFYFPCDVLNKNSNRMVYLVNINLTNRVDYFNIFKQEFNSSYIPINLRKLKKGDYKLFGTINVYKFDKNTPISNIKTDDLHIYKSFIVNYEFIVN